MNLKELQALRPADGADSAAIEIALSTALTARREATERRVAAEAIRADTLAHDDKALRAAGADADAARLELERLDVLFPLLRADLAAARGRETLEDLRERAQALEPLAERVRVWWRDTYPKIEALIGEGLHAQHDFVDATHKLVARVEVEYARPEVRDAGPLGFTFPEIGDHLPEVLFPNFERVP